MTKAIAISFDGVLKRERDEGRFDSTIVTLYKALVENFRVIVLGTEDTAKDEHYLKENGFFKYALIEPEVMTDSPLPLERRKQQLARLRAQGWDLELVIVPDPWMAKWLYAAGWPVLMYLQPDYFSSAFDPSSPRAERSWGELIQKVDYTRAVKTREMEKQDEDD